MSLDRSRWTVQYMQRVLATDPIAYWMQDEKQGLVSYDMVTARSDGARNGAYTGPTLGQPGIGDGRTAPFFDGVTDFDDVGTVSLLAAFPGPEGSLMVWDFPDPLSLNDAAFSRLFLARDNAAANVVDIQHTGVNANIRFQYTAGTVTETGNANLGAQPTTFQCLLMTWSAANDRVRYYRNGGVADAEDNGLGVWGAQPTRALIGAGSVVPMQQYLGRLAHGALWNRELMPAVALSLGVL